MMLGKCAAAAIVLVVAVGCRRPSSEPAKPSSRSHGGIRAADDDSTERDNLLNYARGAVVVARSGEFALWTSALLAIDGDPDSCWLAPPGETRQWLVAALPTETRVEQLGLSNSWLETGSAASVTFESSMDGVTFSPLGVVDGRTRNNGLLVGVTPPVPARYVRATLNEDSAHHGASICSLQVRGVETAARRQVDVTGCWTVNGSKMALAQEGDHIAGQLEGSKPTLIDGGSDGRLVRFSWMRDREFGYGAFSVEDSGEHLSGRMWHEEPIPLFGAESWFGERTPCSGTKEAGGMAVAATFFQRAGRFPLYGLRTASDGTIEAARSLPTLRILAGWIRAAGSRPIRLEAHEFRQRDAAADRAFAGRELESLQRLLEGAGVSLSHTELIVLGSQQPRQVPRTADQRALYSSIEVVVPTAKTLAR
jgi:hypothetical protein